MNLVLPRPDKILGQASFRPEDFVSQIEGDGTLLQWERRELCPCRSAQGEPRVDCTVCHGLGWDYQVAQQVRGVISKVSYAPKIWQEWGSWGWGVCSVSLRWEHTPSWGDRYTLVYGVMERQELIEHLATVDSPQFPIAPTTMDLVVNGKVQPTVVATLHCRVQTATGLGGAIRVEGTDYEVDADGNVDWTLGEGLGTNPAVGEYYSLRYLFHPRYKVLEHPFAVRQVDSVYKSTTQTSQAFPVSVLCRLDWLPEPEASP